MVGSLKRTVLVIGVLAIGIRGIGQARAGAADEEIARAVTHRVAATYPPIARQLRLGGTVKLEAVVAPDGKVTSVKVIGGHPVLVKAATEAADRWTYAAGPKETHERLVFEFTRPE